MSVFRARSHRFNDEDEPRICFNCLSECQSSERYDDCVRCEECLLEDEKMEDSSFDHIDELEARERIA